MSRSKVDLDELGASRWAGHELARWAAVLLYAGEAILAFSRLRTSGSK
jgi:hypothetical protein